MKAHGHYTDYGKWRKARREHKCNGLGYTARWKCTGTGIIRVGERYFDTGDIVDPPYGTHKMCMICADRETARP